MSLSFLLFRIVNRSQSSWEIFSNTVSVGGSGGTPFGSGYVGSSVPYGILYVLVRGGPGRNGTYLSLDGFRRFVSKRGI